MNGLRKRPTFSQMMHAVDHPPVFKHPVRKGLKLINDPFISNLLADDDVMDDTFVQAGKQRLLADKTTQTPATQGTQTDPLDKDTQVNFYDYEEDDYQRRPHMYRKIDATSKRKKNNQDYWWFFRNKEKNDATSLTLRSDYDDFMDNMNQTSRYIPGSLQKRVDNINQTVRYELKQFENPIPTPPASEGKPSPIPSREPSRIPSPIPSPEPSREPSRIPSPIPSPAPSSQQSLEPSPVGTPRRKKPQPPSSSSSEYEFEQQENEAEADENEVEDDENQGLDESEIYLRRYGYMAWFQRYFLGIQPEPDVGTPMDGVMDLALPEEPQAITDPYQGEQPDEDETEMIWYNARNKNKRKKK